ncbi:MAG: hypothetical protein KDC35_06510 [Acidobacteria bacterium]|nr:hypothetical protein [Acidobacteriota bacterium]
MISCSAGGTPVHLFGNAFQLHTDLVHQLPVFNHPFDLAVHCQKARIPIISFCPGPPFLEADPPWHLLNHVAWSHPNNQMVVKIFGERRTGTNALSKSIAANLDVQVASYAFLGWKHRLAPNPAEIAASVFCPVQFLVTVRHPYTWAWSMYKNPFHFRADRSFEEFLKSEIGDSADDGFNNRYAHPVDMWNIKYQAYRQLEHAFFVKLEHFAVHPLDVLTALKERTQCTMAAQPKIYTSRIDETGTITSSEFKQATLDPRQIPALSRASLDFMNCHFDWHLAESFGYTKQRSL